MSRNSFEPRRTWKRGSRHETRCLSCDARIGRGNSFCRECLDRSHRDELDELGIGD
jgi:hypothetical protein